MEHVSVVMKRVLTKLKEGKKMATTVEDLERWYKAGKQKKATHLIVVCDTYDHEDYPTYVAAGETVAEKLKYYNGPNMQRVMEVYNLSKPFNGQKMKGRLCWDEG